MRAVSGGESAEDRNAQAGQAVAQDIGDAPSSRRRIIRILVEAEELAERDTAQPVQDSGAGQLGQRAVDFPQPCALPVFEKEDCPLQTRQAGSGRDGIAPTG